MQLGTRMILDVTADPCPAISSTRRTGLSPYQCLHVRASSVRLRRTNDTELFTERFEGQQTVFPCLVSYPVLRLSVLLFSLLALSARSMCLIKTRYISSQLLLLLLLLLLFPQSPPLFVFLASLRGKIFVPGTAGARVSLTTSSTSTSHVTHLMLLTLLSASILIITLVLLISITFGTLTTYCQFMTTNVSHSVFDFA